MIMRPNFASQGLDASKILIVEAEMLVCRKCLWARFVLDEAEIQVCQKCL